MHKVCQETRERVTVILSVELKPVKLQDKEEKDILIKFNLSIFLQFIVRIFAFCFIIKNLGENDNKIES